MFFSLPWVYGLFPYDPSSSYELQAATLPASPAADELITSLHQEEQSPTLHGPHSLLPGLVGCCGFVFVDHFSQTVWKAGSQDTYH